MLRRALSLGRFRSLDRINSCQMLKRTITSATVRRSGGFPHTVRGSDQRPSFVAYACYRFIYKDYDNSPEKTAKIRTRLLQVIDGVQVVVTTA